MDNNKDLLKVENLKRNQYIVNSSVIIPRDEEKKEIKQKRITLFSVILSAFVWNSKKENLPPVRAVNTLKTLLTFLAIAAVLCASFFFADAKITMSLTVIFLSVFLPAIIITFHYEICMSKKVSFVQMFLSFAFGVTLFIFINTLAETFLSRIIYPQTTRIVIKPILWGLGELIFVTLLIKVYHITELASGILIAICVGVGYAFINFLYEEYSILLNFFNVNDSVNIFELINDNQKLNALTLKLITDSLKYSLLGPVLYACWSVVIGNIVSLNGLDKTSKHEKSITVYMLLLLTILLNILSIFPTSISYFDAVLKAICALISVLIALAIENTSLAQTFAQIEQNKTT